MAMAAQRADRPAQGEPPRAFATGAQQHRDSLAAVALRCGSRPLELRAPLTRLQGAGPRLSAAAAELGIADLGDLLLHVPHGYRDRTEISSVGDLRIGEEATVQVEVRSARLRPTRRRRLTILEAKVADESGTATAIWFNQAWLADKLGPGTRLLLQGKLERRGFRVAAHEVVSSEALGRDDSSETLGRDGRAGTRRSPAGIHTTGIVPVHPASEALRAQRIRDWAWQALPLARHALEPLPAELRFRRDLCGAGDAIVSTHFPLSEEDAEEARRRLAFEELFLYQASLASRRQRREQARSAKPLEPRGELVERWLTSLPFVPTGDQRRAFAEIDRDLGAERPMQRLLMGEVGAGKTVCALFAMLRAVESGFQAVMMAPTETLAEQHFATLERLLAAEVLPAALLTGATPPARRRELLSHLASGQLGLLVGTHALIEPQVEWARLAVAVVDEQHRFGVRQRAALDAKGPGDFAPHVLHMTATPIPRTLSLTAYGDLDATTLRELPAGRPPVRTWVVGEERRAGAYEFVRQRLGEGRQAFVVCPLVSESERLQAKAATDEGARLAAGEFGDFAVDVLHGQMASAAKQTAMAGFAAGDTDVLVCTSVIEVGIDVANATVMLIEGAERYGISQLHQLRGRVGRGQHESQCILFAGGGSEAARARLDAITAERDGFKLAEIDLGIRGEGEILGTRQHGLPRFRVARLPEDTVTLIAARQEVLELLRAHGTLDAAELGPLMDAARLRFGDELSDTVAP